MARFDVFLHGEAGYLLDVQANILRDLNTRMVVPLLPLSQAPRPISRLNPILSVAGVELIMMTQWMAAVPTAELTQPVTRLRDQDFIITGALDFLLSGI